MNRPSNVSCVRTEVWSVMRRVSCLRLEALRLMGALQDAAGVGPEPAWRALLGAAAARADLDTLLRLHHTALDRHSIHAMIHHTTQVTLLTTPTYYAHISASKFSLLKL